MSKLTDLFSKKPRTNAISVVMLVLFFSVFPLLYLFRDYWLETTRVFNISIELILMAILLIFYRLHLRQIRSDNKSERLFTDLCVVLYLCLFMDLISWMVDGAKDFAWLNAVSNGSVLIFEFLHGLLFFSYIFENIEKATEGLKKHRKSLEWVNASVLLIRVILVFAGVYFRIDEDGVFVMTDISILSFFFIPVMTLYACGIAAGAGLKKSRLAGLLSYPLSSLFMVAMAFISISYTNSLITLSLSVILIYCLLFADTTRENAGLSDSVKTYLSLDDLDNEPEPAAGNSCVSTILFCDLHHFSKDMEIMEPEDAIVMLNRYYSDTASLIEKNNGRLLEYPGYGLFCLFSGAFQVTDAVNAAKEIMRETAEINRSIADEHYAMRFRPGIGISTGEVVVGNIGSVSHMRYSCIGRTVNLASRAASKAKDGTIVLTQDTLDADRENLSVESAGMFIPKGINKPVRIYTVSR